MGQVQTETDLAEILSQTAVEDPSPLGRLGVGTSEQQQQNGGADVGVKLVLPVHPLRNELVKQHVSRRGVSSTVDRVRQEVKGHEKPKSPRPRTSSGGQVVSVVPFPAAAVLFTLALLHHHHLFRRRGSRWGRRETVRARRRQDLFVLLVTFGQEEVDLSHDGAQDVDPNLPVVPEEVEVGHGAHDGETDVDPTLRGGDQDHVQEHRTLHFREDRPQVLVVPRVHGAVGEDVCQVEHLPAPEFHLHPVRREPFGFGLVPVSREQLAVVEQEGAVRLVESKVDVVGGDEGDYEGREVEPEGAAEQGARHIEEDLGLGGLVVSVDELKQSQRREVAGDAEKDVGGEAGVKVPNDGQFQDVLVAVVTTPGHEPGAAERHQPVESEDLDGGDAAEAVEVAGRELFRFRRLIVPYPRSEELRDEAVREPFTQPVGMVRSEKHGGFGKDSRWCTGERKVIVVVRRR